MKKQEKRMLIVLGVLIMTSLFYWFVGPKYYKKLIAPKFNVENVERIYVGYYLHDGYTIEMKNRDEFTFRPTAQMYENENMTSRSHDDLLELAAKYPNRVVYRRTRTFADKCGMQVLDILGLFDSWY